MHDRQVELELAAEPSSPQIARDALAQLVALPPDLLDRAQLITSELVTNGVRHGNDEAGGCIRFSAELHPTFLRIEVTNPATASRPTLQPRGELRSSGYGLIIVDALADRWGSDVHGAVRVWCELELDPEPALGPVTH
jgi:anti-sigma regulatory factor (Ser/Thr protein kinase)